MFILLYFFKSHPLAVADNVGFYGFILISQLDVGVI